MGELIGYARCSTVLQDLTAQRQALAALGVPDDRIYLDKGLTGTSRARPGLDQALAAVRPGDTLVVPKLDRLARSVPDARHIGDSLVARGIKLSLGGTIYDPADPLGKMFFNILATFAEFEVDLLRLRTREGMAVARAKGKLQAASSPSSPPASKPSSPACTPPANTPSPTSWKSSPSAAPPFTAPSSAPHRRDSHPGLTALGVGHVRGIAAGAAGEPARAAPARHHAGDGGWVDITIGGRVERHARLLASLASTLKRLPGASFVTSATRRCAQGDPDTSRPTSRPVLKQALRN